MTISPHDNEALLDAYMRGIERLSGEVSAQAVMAWDAAKDKRTTAGRLLERGDKVWKRGARLAMAYFRLRMALEAGQTVPNVVTGEAHQPSYVYLGDLVAEFENVAGVPVHVAVTGLKKITVIGLKAGAVSLRDRQARDVGLIADRFEELAAKTGPDGEDMLRNRFAGFMQELSSAGYRQLVEDMVRRTDVFEGWCRVSRSGTPCAWCAMLISRGPVYKSKETAMTVHIHNTIPDLGHPHCQCVVVPISRKEWESNTSPQFVQARMFEDEWESGMGLKNWRAKHWQLHGKQWRKEKGR